MMNVFLIGAINAADDPLGLSDLAEPRPEPGSLEQDWAMVSAALDRRRQRRRQAWFGSLAAAASVALVIALLAVPPKQPATPGSEGAMTAEAPPERGSPSQPSGEGAGESQPTTAELVAMSQNMEKELRFLRAQVGTMPSEALVYQVELQDLIGQVDDTLSISPDSRELWAQRLDLQLDLMKLYRNELRRDYLRLASL